MLHSPAARHIRLQERRWGFMARDVLAAQHAATVAAASREADQFHEVVGRWQNMSVSLWLKENARVDEEVTLICASRAVELCTGASSSSGRSPKSRPAQGPWMQYRVQCQSPRM